MLVCHCKRVTDTAVRDTIRAGARSAEEVAAHCRAGTGCGGCRPLIDALIDEEASVNETPDLVRLPVAS